MRNCYLGCMGVLLILFVTFGWLTISICWLFDARDPLLMSRPITVDCNGATMTPDMDCVEKRNGQEVSRQSYQEKVNDEMNRRTWIVDNRPLVIFGSIISIILSGSLTIFVYIVMPIWVLYSKYKKYLESNNSCG